MLKKKQPVTFDRDVRLIAVTNEKTEKKKNQIKIKMKTTAYILLAITGIQTSVFAADFSGNAGLTDLMPVTPREASFEEISITPGSILDLSDLMPVVPSEADFAEGVPAGAPEMESLIPVLPAEAEFEEVNFLPAQLPSQDLRPVTPVTAEFEDIV